MKINTKITLLLAFTILKVTIPSLYAETKSTIGLMADYAETRSTIGLMADLSGKFHDIGDKCREGYQLAISQLPEEVRGKLDFVYEDQGSNPKQAVNAFQSILKEKELVGAVHFGSHTAIATNPLSLRNKLPVVGLSAHPDFIRLNKYAFSSWMDGRKEAGFYASRIIEKGLKRVAIITTEHDYTLALRDAFLEKGKDEGDFTITFDEVLSDDTDFRSMIPRITSSNTEAIFINLLPPTFSIFLKQLGQMGYKGEKLSLNSNAENQYIEAAGAIESEGTIFYVPDHRKSFYQGLVKEESSYSYTCYLGLKFMLSAVAKTLNSSELSREALFNTMLSLSEFPLGNETMQVRNRRLVYDLTVKKAEGGKVRFLE